MEKLSPVEAIDEFFARRRLTRALGEAIGMPIVAVIYLVFTIFYPTIANGVITAIAFAIAYYLIRRYQRLKKDPSNPLI